MGWTDTKNKQQHVQVVTSAWDMQRIEERNRKRRWFIFLDAILGIFILIGIIYLYYNHDYKTGLIFIIIGLLILVYLIFKKKSQRNKRNFSRHRNFRRRRRRHRRR